MKTTRTMFKLLPAAAFVAASALLFAGGAASAPRIAPCGASDAVVWLETRGDPGAGNVYYTLAITNLSRAACTLHGYPGISAVDLAGRQIGRAADQTAQTPVRTVSIRSGGTGRFILRLNNVGVFPASSCRPATAAGLRVYLPSSRQATVVPIPFGACTRSGPTFLHVAAVSS
jgi:hypothetical protein